MMPNCEVCDGTGKYEPSRIAELYSKRKPHRCSGTCDKCGQYFSDDDLEWLSHRLEIIERLITQLNKGEIRERK